VSTIPAGIGIIDTMIGFPRADVERNYDFLRPLLKDDSAALHMPAGYMFKERTNRIDEGDDPVAMLVAAMDEHGIEQGLIGLENPSSREALARHPDRFFATLMVDPNDIMGAVRAIRGRHDEGLLAAVNVFPAGCNPQVPVSDRRMYAIYAVCVELGLPILVNAGVPGPRVPMACQHVELFDQVCYDFPELRIVMRHGAEPWEELAVKLMIKWPGLYYSTSAFAPKHYPKAIIDYANTRGADKILYAGYYPMGLTLDRIMSELPLVPFREHVWPKFLRDNAKAVFGR
jgi:predicted TIM-barrel fold metal-dependent hydrolase